MTVWRTGDLGEAWGYWEAVLTSSSETQYSAHRGWSSTKTTETTEVQQDTLMLQMHIGLQFGPLGAGE